MKKIFIAFVVLIFVVVGFFYLYQKPVQKNININNKAETAKSATYLIDNKSVTLVNGLSEMEIIPDSASKIITRYFGNDAIGDLNGDGRADIAFLLTQETGGSGIFYYIAVALAGDGGYQGLNAILLGDRIAPQTTEINNGRIVVNYADRKSGEPFTTMPSIGVSKYFQVVNNYLVGADSL